MRLPIEARAIVTGQVVTTSSVLTLRDVFPLGGEIWHTLRLVFTVTPTHTTATNPIVLGVYNLIKNLKITTSKNETILSCPGLGMYYLNWMLKGVEPFHVPNTGTTATPYVAVIDIPFSHALLARKEDIALDSGRYTHIELEITFGGADSFFGAASEGDATLATTLDVTLFRNKSGFEKTGKPLALPYIKHIPPYALSRGYTDIESAEDLTLFGFNATVQDMAAQICHDPIVGLPYSGTVADNMDDVTFRDNVIAYLNLLKMEFFQEERCNYAGVDQADLARIVGQYPYVFIREGSIFNAYWTGQKSEIRLENNTVALGTPTTPQIDVVIFGMREMRE